MAARCGDGLQSAMPKARMSEIARKVGERIAVLRKAAGVTQDSLAATLKTTASVISRMERGWAGVSLERLEEIAEVLHVSPVDFLDFEGSVAEKSEPDIRRVVAILRALEPDDRAMVAEVVEVMSRRLRRK